MLAIFVLLAAVIQSYAICSKWYKIKAWDTCYAISQKYGVFDLDDFTTKYNPGVDCQKLQIGDVLCVEMNDEEEEPCERYVEVGNGDSCYSMSVDYYLTRRQFDQLNPLLDCLKLVGGDKVCVTGEYTKNMPPEDSNA